MTAFWYDGSMAAQGKELERQLTAEEIASRQVEGYIEQVEKKPEIPADVQQWVGPGSASINIPQLPTEYGQQVMQSAQQQAAPITLPITAEELNEGLDHKVMDSIRWLAEWSIKMIKKYPGRVFYSKPS